MQPDQVYIDVTAFAGMCMSGLPSVKDSSRHAP